MTWLRVVLAASVILAASLPAYAATAANRDLERIPFNLGFLVVVATILVVIGNRPMLMASDRRLRAARRIKFIFGMPLCWLVLSLMRLGPTRPIVLVSGEPPYLLHRVSYLTDPAYAGRFDANPLHLPHAAE